MDQAYIDAQIQQAHIFQVKYYELIAAMPDMSVFGEFEHSMNEGMTMIEEGLVEYFGDPNSDEDDEE
jgi:hypothetical protein